MILGEAGFFMRIFRGLFGIVDGIVYRIFAMLIKVYFGLSEINILDAETVRALKIRIYIFVSIYMIFKVSIALIQAMINPEIANDKKVGLGSVVSRIAVAIIMLVAVPLAMDYFLFGSTNGRSNQEIIASLIPKVILGSNNANTISNPEAQDDIGQHIASATLTAFFSMDEDCGSTDNKLKNMKVSSIVNHVSDVCELEGKSKYFKYNYSFIISTICGVIMVVLILGYSIDLISRALKLQILEMLAPIPILSYVDPGKGKDNLFNTWFKTLISTYCDFFIKLGTLYFIIFAMVAFVNNIDSIIPSSFTIIEKGYAIVIVIIGLLLALQQIPQFICTIFGIKPQGMGAGLGTLLGAASGLVAGGAAGMLSGAVAGAQDGLAGKAGLGTLNKGKEAAKKDIFGNKNMVAAQKQANKEYKQKENYAKKHGYAQAKEQAETEYDNAVIAEAAAQKEMNKAQEEYDLALAEYNNLPEEQKKDPEALKNLTTARNNLTEKQNAYVEKQGATAKARTNWEKKKSAADDPIKARAKDVYQSRKNGIIKQESSNKGNNNNGGNSGNSGQGSGGSGGK